MMMVQAAVVPGRMLNSNHEEIFAQQAKELQKTKSKGRKPVGHAFLAFPLKERVELCNDTDADCFLCSRYCDHSSWLVLLD